MLIKKPNREILPQNGILEDFEEVMKYFNEGLKLGNYPYIPRKTPITVDEIRKLWMPSLDKNLTLLVEHEGKTIGSATVFYDLGSTGYEQTNQRQQGEIGLTWDTQFPYKVIADPLMRQLMAELHGAKKQGVLHTDINFKEERSLMEHDLRIKGKEVFLQRYKDAGLSGKVIEYIIG